jgi:DNA-directed RNA polymerase subunit RPC12/RpoP
MGIEDDFARLIDRSPKVVCPNCHVEMILRTLVPVSQPGLFKAGYRCRKCGTDTERQFKVDP